MRGRCCKGSPDPGQDLPGNDPPVKIRLQLEYVRQSAAFGTDLHS
jgi:hypothetical protein